MRPVGQKGSSHYNLGTGRLTLIWPKVLLWPLGGALSGQVSLSGKMDEKVDTGYLYSNIRSLDHFMIL